MRPQPLRNCPILSLFARENRPCGRAPAGSLGRAPGRTAPWAGRFRDSWLCHSRCVGFTTEQSAQSRFSTCTLRVSQLLG